MLLAKKKTERAFRRVNKLESQQPWSGKCYQKPKKIKMLCSFLREHLHIALLIILPLWNSIRIYISSFITYTNDYFNGRSCYLYLKRKTKKKKEKH